MYVLSLFEHSIKLELALRELEENNIEKECILANPLQQLDQKHYLDPYNTESLNFFIVSCVGMICMLLGSIYGFVLYLGPIIWGLIGLIVGVLIGLIIDIVFKKYLHTNRKKKNKMDVVLIVKCNADTIKLVEEIVINHQAFAITKF